MTSYLHLNCKFDAKIEIYCLGKKNFEVFSPSCLQNEIDLEIFDLQNFSLKIYPIGKSKNVAYSANFEYDGKNIVSNSKQVLVFPLPQNHFYFLIFPLTLKESGFDNYDKIEIDGEKIKTLTLLPGIKKRAKVEIFESCGDKLKESENYFVSLKQDYLKNINPAISLLEFFQDLFVLDLNSAKEYLTTQLSQKLTKNAITNFFGKFDECCLVNYYEDFAVVLFNYESNLAKVFAANFENNLISNIYEID